MNASAAPRRYYNTGVLLINARRLRERGITHPSTLLSQLSSSASHGKSRYDEFGLGEQNLLNAWLSERPGLVTALPCRWNRRIDRACDDPLPGLRHANRMVARPRDSEHTESRLSALLQPASGRGEGMARGAPCTDAQLRPEFRGNASARAECAFLMAKRAAHADVKVWHDRYHALPCASAAASADAGPQ